MKKRILFILSTFVFFIVVFLIFKSVFTLLYASIGGGVSVADFFAVLYNGLGMDMSTSGYLTALPALLTLFTLWIKPSWIKKVLYLYFLIVAFLLTLIYILDFVIYPNWGYHFDSAVFLYMESPQGAMASGTFLETLLGAIGLVGVTTIIYCASIKLLLQQMSRFDILEAKKTIKAGAGAVLLLLMGALFIVIRGGVTVSTMNVGQAYFSDNMYLNHAAINPHFNLMYSASKSKRFDKEYQFFNRGKADEIFSTLTSSKADSTLSVLTTNRPNIVLFVLESFSAKAAYDSVVAPNFHQLAKEGVNFSNFYANSFRTDRGVVSVLSGYPAHPTVALMKYPKKTQTLPSIPKSLVENGYTSAYYYGGDNDYASMRSYIVGACATKDVFGDTDFPISKRMTKWGVPDEYVFERVFDDLTTGKFEQPFITTVLTLSSHEPFDVPPSAIKDPYLNSVHYTDGEIGKFVAKLKETDLWDNTLLVFLADHCMQSFPKDTENYAPAKYHIPLLWAGGAVKEAREIKDFGSQNDLASTLLGQLNIEYSDFLFSKNMLDQNEHKFAFYAYNNGFSMIDTSGVVIYDNNAKKTLKKEGNDLEEKAKAFFQKMYLDLGER